MDIDLFIVGAQKTGSTSVFNWLKETNLFQTHVQPEMSYYMLSHELKEGCVAANKRYFGNKREPNKPLLAKHAMAAYDYPTLQRIQAFNPRVKVIFIMRDPIKRAYSAFWYAKLMGWESAKTLRDAINNEKHFKDYVSNRNSFYIYNSEYQKHVKDIIEVFGSENLLLLTEGDIHKGKAFVCKLVGELLNIPINSNGTSNDRYNEGGLPKSIFLSKVIAKILSPKNPLKRLLGSVMSTGLKNGLRNKLQAINRSKNKYPTISDTEQRFLQDELYQAVEFYNSISEE